MMGNRSIGKADNTPPMKVGENMSSETKLSTLLEAMAAEAREREAREQASEYSGEREVGMRERDAPAVRHMRTIDAAWKHVKEMDPDTSLTKSALRRLVISGTIPHTRIGSKYLVCLETLDEFLKGQTAEKPPETESVGGIRRLEARI